ncbi:MAG: transposase, partial [Cyanobacteriota bacterium]
MLSLEDLFCSVDDFCQQFELIWQNQLLGNGVLHRNRRRSLCLSEMMSTLIAFHQSSYRNFKAYYTEKVQAQWHSAFPGFVSYGRFVECIPSNLLPLCAYLHSCFGRCSGISFLDSTSLKVCHNRRINQHKVFKNLAARGKTSVDSFFWFKVH